VGREVAALVCGRLDDNRFHGRNTFPLIGRPMMVYPIPAVRLGRSRKAVLRWSGLGHVG